ncbi:hypothetical protein Tco_1275592 [Tanacetum coccineum]
MQTDSSREIRTEVDEEQQTNTDSAAERSEQRCIAQNHINTEINESRTGRQQQIQTDNSRFRQTATDSDSNPKAKTMPLPPNNRQELP